jgi:hypothetical protein
MTPAEVARHWIDIRTLTVAELLPGHSLRDVGPYRVVLQDGHVIGHTLAREPKR